MDATAAEMVDGSARAIGDNGITMNGLPIPESIGAGRGGKRLPVADPPDEPMHECVFETALSVPSDGGREPGLRTNRGSDIAADHTTAAGCGGCGFRYREGWHGLHGDAPEPLMGGNSFGFRHGIPGAEEPSAGTFVHNVPIDTGSAKA